MPAASNAAFALDHKASQFVFCLVGVFGICGLYNCPIVKLYNLNSFFVQSSMTYDDFSNKLREIKEEYERAKKSKMSTVKQLEDYLVERKEKRFSKGLKSLKGLRV